MTTLALDDANWDLTVDDGMNIAVASGGQDIAQDVASAVKLFQGELWYDTTQGAPWFENVLGQNYSLRVLQELVNSAALSVPGVVQARTTIDSVTDRGITGRVEIIDTNGTLLNAQFTR